MSQTSKTEQRAITAVRTEIDRYSKLESHLNENDKTISWDGEIFVYNTDACRKEDLRGRVPVQVKGISLKKQPTDPTISYSLSIDDLTNYKKDQGILLFVVALHLNGEAISHKIYYATLLPVELKQLLQVLPDSTKTKTIKCRQLSNSHPNLEEICFDFIRDANIQKGQMADKSLSFKQVREFGLKTCVYMYTKPENLIDNVFNVPHFVYAKYVAIPGNQPFDVPVGKFEFTSITQKSDLFVDGKQIAKSVPITTYKNQPSVRVIKIAPSITIKLDQSTNQGNVLYQETGTIKERAHDARLMYTLHNSKELKMTGLVATIHSTNTPKEEMERFKYRAQFLDDLEKVLNFFEVKLTLDWNKFTSACITNVKGLSKAIEDPQHLLMLTKELESPCSVSMVSIANLNLLMLFKQIQGKTYSVHNFFSYPFEEQDFCISDGEHKIPVSRYSKLEHYHFEQVSNIPYDRMKLELCSIPFSQQYEDCLTKTFLSMLLAYDKTGSAQLFTVLKAVNGYLLRHSPKNNVNIINKMQLISRNRNLNKVEKAQLETIQKSTKESVELLAIAILLQKPNIKELYAQLPSEQQIAFDSWPISHLWKRK